MGRERDTSCTDNSFPAVETRTNDLNAIAKVRTGVLAEALSRRLDETIAGGGKSTADHDPLGCENRRERSETEPDEVSRHTDCADRRAVAVSGISYYFAH